MKRHLIPLLLVLALAFALAACGANTESATPAEPAAASEPDEAEDVPVDPNVGVYTATLVEMYGVGIDPQEIFADGFVIALLNDGKCVIVSDGERADGVWTLEDETFTIDDGTSTISGTLADGVMKVVNMLDMGLDITLVKEE